MYRFMDPKNGFNYFHFFGTGKSFIAFDLSNKSIIPVIEILNPSHSISF